MNPRHPSWGSLAQVEDLTSGASVMETSGFRACCPVYGVGLGFRDQVGFRFSVLGLQGLWLMVRRVFWGVSDFGFIGFGA